MVKHSVYPDRIREIRGQKLRTPILLTTECTERTESKAFHSVPSVVKNIRFHDRDYSDPYVPSVPFVTTQGIQFSPLSWANRIRN